MTPTATAVGFSDHRSQCCGFGLTAPSGPVDPCFGECASEDDLSGIHVRVRPVAARRAAEPCGTPVTDVHRAADSTGARRVCRGDLDDAPTSFFRFVGEELLELAPALVADRAVQPGLLCHLHSGLLDGAAGGPDHVADLQGLYADHRVAVSDPTRKLVRVIAATARFALPLTGQQQDRFAAPTRPSPTAGDLSGSTSHPRLVCPLSTGPDHTLPCRKRREVAHSDIDSDHRARLRMLRALLRPGDLNANREVPAAPITRTGDLHLAQHRVFRQFPVPLHLHAAHTLQSEPAMFDRDAASVPFERPHERVKPASTLKPRVAGLLARSEPSKECFERPVQPPEHGLLTPKVRIWRKQPLSAQRPQLSRLIRIADRHTMFPPHSATVFQCGVIKVAARCKLTIQGVDLRPRRIQPVAVGTQHVRSPASPPVHISSERPLGHISDRPAVVLERARRLTSSYLPSLSHTHKTSKRPRHNPADLARRSRAAIVSPSTRRRAPR